LTRVFNAMSHRYRQKMDQSSKWQERQKDVFTEESGGVTLHNLWVFAQKYAMPLLLGILIALIWSNVDNTSYQALCGPSHHGSSSVVSNKTNSTGSSSSSSHRLLLSTSSSQGSTPKPTILGLSFHGHDVTLNFLVNDVLMTLFFGLAVKEITEALQSGGSLHPISRAINPLLGTLGGVIGPIAMYFITILIQNSMGVFEGIDFSVVANGWGIPTATDISLAWVTALIVFGRGHPAIEHLLLLAIVDDAIGLVIIAVAYGDPSNTNPLRFLWLLLVIVGIFVAWGLNKLKVMRWELYVCLAGPFCWFGLLLCSLHPALALVFVVPFMPATNDTHKLHHDTQNSEDEKRDDDDDEDDNDDNDDDNNDGGKETEHGSHAPLHEFEHQLKWFVDCVVLFLFGLTNAGVQLNGIGALTLSIMVSLTGNRFL
jgi:NhaA family Na+:H+ antiporter